jgi:hypothetical protein
MISNHTVHLAAMVAWLLPLVVVALVGHTSSYRIVIDLNNTYDSSDMAFAASGQLSYCATVFGQ